MQTTKERIVVSTEDQFLKLNNRLDILSSKIDALKKPDTIAVEWIPRLVYMEKCNIGSTKFNIIRDKLQTKNIGRKLFVHVSCIDKYFNNEL